MLYKSSKLKLTFLYITMTTDRNKNMNLVNYERRLRSRCNSAWKMLISVSRSVYDELCAVELHMELMQTPPTTPGILDERLRRHRERCY